MSTRQHCPQCGHDTIVYNGNYFCAAYWQDPSSGCGWVHKPYGVEGHDPAFEKRIVADELARREAAR